MGRGSTRPSMQVLREVEMRLIFGFIVGVVLTIAGAYGYDSRLPPSSNQRLVNWDAATELSRWGMERARQEWDKLTAK